MLTQNASLNIAGHKDILPTTTMSISMRLVPMNQCMFIVVSRNSSEHVFDDGAHMVFLPKNLSRTILEQGHCFCHFGEVGMVDHSLLKVFFQIGKQ